MGNIAHQIWSERFTREREPGLSGYLWTGFKNGNSDCAKDVNRGILWSSLRLRYRSKAAIDVWTSNVPVLQCKASSRSGKQEAGAAVRKTVHDDEQIGVEKRYIDEKKLSQDNWDIQGHYEEVYSLL